MFVQSDVDKQLRAAVLRVLERGIPWKEIQQAGLLQADESNIDEVVTKLTQLKPLLASAYIEVEPPSGPSLVEKRRAWQRLNETSFQD